MLISQPDLAAIREGRIDAVFRRWDRPRVLAGTKLRTRIGLIEVLEVTELADSDVTEEDARRAGVRSREALLARQPRKAAKPLFRVEVRYAGADPRVALRELAEISAEDRAEIDARLTHFDAVSPHGPWTRRVLELIAERPETESIELAGALGREQLSFKRDVRKLKELGLTESLKPGYRLSPRGRAYLDGAGAGDSPS
ncbi:hypothetical protein HJD18_08935 [Thermoleophilia bacterium SCSIO 60948]|nr:hypothetical protein HJD18_08935 [Thermoleophilia bacterium SCSIO 60948]